MPRFILTGAPGAGKTVLLRALERAGHPVVEEAATDVIALNAADGVDAPWTSPDFIDQIIGLQRLREDNAAVHDGQRPVFFDRSPVCTLALARYLGFAPSPALLRALDRVGAYDRRVLFVEDLGFVTPTAARRISHAEARDFGRFHVEAYEAHGFDLLRIPAAGSSARLAAVLSLIGEPS